MGYEDKADKQISEAEESRIISAIVSRKARIKSIKEQISELDKEIATNKDEIKQLDKGNTECLAEDQYCSNTLTLGGFSGGLNYKIG